MRTSIGTDLSEDQAAELCEVISTVGALAAVESRIETLTRTAVDVLNATPVAEQAKVGLLELEPGQAGHFDQRVT